MLARVHLRVRNISGSSLRPSVAAFSGGPHSATEEVGRTLYPNTFQPLKVAHVTLKNRVLMGSMHTGLEEVGLFGGGKLDEMAAYFAERLSIEVGMVIPVLIAIFVRILLGLEAKWV